MKKSLLVGMIMLSTVILFDIPAILSQSSGVNDQREDNYLEFMKMQSQRLYEFEKQLMEIQAEIKSIVRDYETQEIEKNEAEERIRALLKKEYAIKYSQDYYVEQMLPALLGQIATQNE